METERDNSQLTLTDIYKMRSVIDVASTRGTFQGKELGLIGELYNKLDVIVQSVEKKSNDSSVENKTVNESDTTPESNKTVVTEDESEVVENVSE